MIFRDRVDAGKQMVSLLRKYENADNGVVVALPRGGIIPAKVIADELRLPLEVVMVKKIGHPMNKEYAIGAISLTSQILNPNVDVNPDYINSETSRLRSLMKERYKHYYKNRDPLNLSGKKVILVDDGVATGSTMLAAIYLLREERVASIIAAVPVGPKETLGELKKVVDEVIFLETPEPFSAVGNHYEHFDQVSDEEVASLLNEK